MNNMVVSNTAPTMTSREIADLTGKRHPDVKRDIDQMLIDLEEDVSKFARIYLDSMNRQQTEYALDRELTETLLTGYSAPLRRAVIARWRELEESPPKAIDLNDPHALRAALLSYSEQVIRLDAKIAADAPKVKFAEAVRALDGVCSVEAIAKTLGYGRNKFFKALKQDGILMESRLPYQKYIDRCYFTVTETAPFTDKDGNTHPTFATRVTGAGQVFLQRKYGRRKDDVV